MDYVNAFWVGGAICALVQILLDKTKLLRRQRQMCIRDSRCCARGGRNL